MKEINFHTNGVNALKDKSKIIGANKHWYSTEDVIINGKYHYEYSILKELIHNRYSNTKFIIREINHFISINYLRPSYYIEQYYNSKYNFSPFLALHLRIGDADNTPFAKYLYENEVNEILKDIKSVSMNLTKIALVSDSLFIKQKFKNEINDIFIVEKGPCHTKYKECIYQALIDIIILKKSKKLILTRGSSFSLFGMYQNDNCMKNGSVSFIGHDNEHLNYY